MHFQWLILITAFLFSNMGMKGQMLQPASPVQRKEVPVYKLQEDPKMVVLEMSYAKAELAQKPEMALVRPGNVSGIELIFTRYPVDFKDWIIPYDTLLQRRLSKINTIFPGILRDSTIRWRYVLQTDCPNAEVARSRFHGFVIHLKTVPTAELSLRGVVNEDRPVPDSTVLEVMDRHPEWKRKLIVMDATGSMAPYLGSVLLWHKLHDLQADIYRYVFFNDGNDRPDHRKRPGRTGGVYQSEATSIEQVIRKLGMVMERGDGGDDWENDVEALYKATRLIDDFGEVVLIADNGSDMRDLHLADSIKVPVRIILCGVESGKPVNTEYLDLARKTRGSVHLIESEIGSLMKLNEGEEIEFNGRKYKLQEGEFVLLSRT